MPVTGIYYHALPQNSTSPTAKLISALSFTSPDKELQPFSLQHRLFVDTSGQLPSQEAKQRSFTHLLTLSHDPTNTFVGALNPQHSPEPALITIPTSDVDNFAALIAARLQPLWYHRQSVAVENGVTVAIRDGTWRVSVGEVRVLGRGQAAPPMLKGYLIELTNLDDEFDLEKLSGDKLAAEGGDVFVEVLRRIFGDVVESFDATHVKVAVTGASTKETQRDDGKDWELAKLYMQVLRTAR